VASPSSKWYFTAVAAGLPPGGLAGVVVNMNRAIPPAARSSSSSFSTTVAPLRRNASWRLVSHGSFAVGE